MTGVARPSITCPACGRTSYHPKDIENRYCGGCHLFHEHMGIAVDHASDDDLLTMYRKWSEADLLGLRAAFTLDSLEPVLPHTQAFCQRRITMINRVLGERTAP